MAGRNIAGRNINGQLEAGIGMALIWKSSKQKFRKFLAKQDKLFLLLLLAIVIISAGCARESQTREPVKMALSIWPGYAHAFIAEKKGFFDKNGVDVELILVRDYLEALQLYSNNEVDGVFEVYADALFQSAEGLNNKVVYIADYSSLGDVIISKPEIRFLEELKGRKIGVDGINTFSHLFALKLLEKAGLKESDVFFESVSAADTLNALEENRIDAGHTWEPVKSQAISGGYTLLAAAGDVPGTITDVLVFDAEFAEERPDDVKAVVKSLLEARDFVYSNREEAVGIMADAEGMSRQEMSSGINGVYMPDIRENIEAMENTGENMEDQKSLHNSGAMIAEFYAGRGQISKFPDLGYLIEPKFVNSIILESR